MTRPHLLPARFRGVAALTALAVMVTASAAWAATTDRHPTVDSAPSVVGFRNRAQLRGHIENGSSGDVLVLERKWNGGEFYEIDRRTVEGSEQVTFWLKALRNSADYRLSWTDAASGETVTSAPRRIAVRAGLSFELKPNDVMAGRRTKLVGSLLPARSRRTVKVQQRIGGRWHNIERVRASDGRFKAIFEPRHHGHRKIRVRFNGDELNAGNVASHKVMVYQRDPATWYGPGFYGHRTACGKTLTTETLGVAHRTLPCGTKVSILYHGRTITVAVIDRGPYAASDWDLTSKTAQRLGFSGSDYIGTVTDR